MEKGLRAQGFATTSVHDGEEACRMARDADFDLLLLDLGLPIRSGFDVLDEIRGRGETLPVILLTARTELEATIDGFEHGANDYLAKPFRFDELLVRVRARLRDRSRSSRNTPGTVSAAGIELDVRTRRATLHGRAIDLSGTEYLLAEVLMRHAGQVLSVFPSEELLPCRPSPTPARRGAAPGRRGSRRAGS